jgi:hypothetical protein
MSLLGIATRNNEVEIRQQPPALGAQVLASLGAFIKWIPGEVVAGYAAAVALDQPKQPPNGPPLPPVISEDIWTLALLACPILLILLSLATKNYEAMVRRAVLAPLAFVLWSASVPHGWWEKFKGFRESQAKWLFALLLVSTAFVAIAELALRPKFKTPQKWWQKIL